MTKKTNTKELSLSFEKALQRVFAGLKLGEPKKRIRKVIFKAGKKVAAEVSHFIKQESKRVAKEKKRALKESIKNKKIKTPVKAAKPDAPRKKSR